MTNDRFSLTTDRLHRSPKEKQIYKIFRAHLHHCFVSFLSLQSTSTETMNCSNKLAVVHCERPLPLMLGLCKINSSRVIDFGGPGGQKRCFLHHNNHKIYAKNEIIKIKVYCFFLTGKHTTLCEL